MAEINLSSTSRFINTNVYTDKNQNTFFGLWNKLELTADDFDEEITVKEKYIGALDKLSYELYGTEEYWWVIADFNNIIDPFLDMQVGDVIKVPSKNKIDLAFLHAQ